MRDYTSSPPCFTQGSHNTGQILSGTSTVSEFYLLLLIHCKIILTIKYIILQP